MICGQTRGSIVTGARLVKNPQKKGVTPEDYAYS